MEQGELLRRVVDIRGVLRVSSSDIDRDYIAAWADRLGVFEAWKLILGR
jgi:hypothetical protein